MEITLEHNGKKYLGEISTIERTSFGYEDHNILTAYLHLANGSSHQGFGGYALDEWDEEADVRVATASGLDHLTQMLWVVGVGEWESLKNAKVIALRVQAYGSIVGIADLDGKRTFFPAERFAELENA